MKGTELRSYREGMGLEFDVVVRHVWIESGELRRIEASDDAVSEALGSYIMHRYEQCLSGAPPLSGQQRAATSSAKFLKLVVDNDAEPS